MPSLLELQHGFADAVFGSEAERFHPALVNGQGAVETAISIYRSSVLGNYRKVLGAIYPVVERLVGERFFSHAATAFAKQTPSRHGDLNRYGQEFADFLAIFPGADQLAYLPDVARLEWAVESVFRAADPSIGNDWLPCVAEGRLDEIVPKLGEHCCLVRSPWPVGRLWALNQPGVAWEDNFSIDAGGEDILVCRRGYEVELETLTPEEADFVDRLNAGIALNRALELANPEEIAKLVNFLGRHLTQGDFALQQ